MVLTAHCKKCLSSPVQSLAKASVLSNIYSRLTLFFHTASRNYVQDAPPPYTPPSGNWYAAPPPAYAGPAEGYGGWVPPTNVFPEQPPRKFALKIL